MSKIANIKELKDFEAKREKQAIERYEKIQAALQLFDPQTVQTPRLSQYNKTQLRSYFTNIPGNEKNLRQLSKYLYYRSQAYRRLIHYNANMIMPEARSIIPNSYNLIKSNDPEKIKKQFYNTAKFLDNLSLNGELLKMYVRCWREDVAYGCCYYEKNEGFFILPLDPDYCKITSTYYTGDLGFSMDMSYFDSRQTQLEMYGEPFTSMYQAYLKNRTTGKYQEMPDQYAICFKVNIADIDVVSPPYIGLFNAILDLTDLEDVQAVNDTIGIYKMLVAKMDTHNNPAEVDDFKVDPDTAVKYINKVMSVLPDWAGLIMSPLEIEAIDLHNDETSGVNKVETATKTLFNTSGGAQVLNSSSISGSTAWIGAIISDSENALSSLIPQTQQWMNRFCSYYITTPAKVKLHEVTSYTKDTFKKSITQDGMYGLPVKLLMNTMNGFSELDTLALNYLEEEVLNLSENFIPLKSSNTMASTTEGEIAPVDELTEEGEATRDQDKNNM